MVNSDDSKLRWWTKASGRDEKKLSDGVNMMSILNTMVSRNFSEGQVSMTVTNAQLWIYISYTDHLYILFITVTHSFCFNMM